MSDYCQLQWGKNFHSNCLGNIFGKREKNSTNFIKRENILDTILSRKLVYPFTAANIKASFCIRNMKLFITFHEKECF